MSRGRLLIAFGSLVSVSASVGLLLFGPAVIHVLDVMTRRIGERVTDLSGGLVAASLSALLFGVGAALVHVGQLVVAKKQAASPAGRCLLVLSATATVLGALAIMHAVGVAQRSFFVIAASATTPEPRELQEAIFQAVPRARLGFAVLLVGQALLVAVGVLGFTADSPRSGSLAGTRFLLGVAAGLSLVFALLFVVNWLHGRSIEALMTSTAVAPKPADVARHLSAITSNLRLAGIWLALSGVCQGVVAFLLPGKA